MDMTKGIYKITNTLISNAYYIGSSVHIEDRWRTHLWALRKNRHENSRLQRAWNKYGESSFTFEIVEIFSGTDEELLVLEDVYLEKLPSTCYNLRRSSFKKRPYNDEIRSKISNGVKLHWKRNRKRMIDSLTVSRQNEEYKRNMSNSCKQAWTNEKRQKMSKNRIGKGNPMADPQIYQLKHSLTGEEFEGMKCDFLKKYPTLNYAGLKKLLTGKWKQYRGWKCKI